MTIQIEGGGGHLPTVTLSQPSKSGNKQRTEIFINNFQNKSVDNFNVVDSSLEDYYAKWKVKKNQKYSTLPHLLFFVVLKTTLGAVQKWTEKLVVRVLLL